MLRSFIFVVLLLNSSLVAPEEKGLACASYDHEEARAHAIKPRRRYIPVEGVRPGFNQMRLTLLVSPSGQVIDAKVVGDTQLLKFWPKVQDEVLRWRFIPFVEGGKAVTAEIEEYIDLVPPERRPEILVSPPDLRQDSKVCIRLFRGGCYGSCPGYAVTVSTDGIVFEGLEFVVASGKHTQSVDADKVLQLARRFLAAEFYSMEDSYRALVTDNPTYTLSIEIDGRKKEVEDYVGQWVGMPSVIAELEDEVDDFAETAKWISGREDIVDALVAEKYDFKTYDAQVLMKETAGRGQSRTVSELLKAGVPITPLPASEYDDPAIRPAFENVGWLNAADGNVEVLKVLIAAGASKNDQSDKDLALIEAARSGNVTAVRALIAYGANPNADLSRLIITESLPPFIGTKQGSGSLLIYAARSGNPEMVREILQYRPRLEKRDSDGRTAIFAAGESEGEAEESARVECIRLLVKAGAKVRVRDNDGNTPLHETYISEVIEELLKLGADVNARNKEGETPIFTTVDYLAIPLFIKYGADLSIRNKEGKTVMESGEPLRLQAIQRATQLSKKK